LLCRFRWILLGDSLYFYGDWFKRSADNFHKIKYYSYQDEVLEIVFNEWECLIVFEPIGIINTEGEFSINQAKMVKWSWYSYGSSEKERLHIFSITWLRHKI